MSNFFYVFIGGGLGSMARYGIADLMQGHNFTFPLATFFANIASCFILGLFVGLSMKGYLGSNLNMFLIGGFCGGFSTFSTFSNETFFLFQSGNYGTAFANIILSVVFCLLSIFVGVKVAG